MITPPGVGQDRVTGNVTVNKPFLFHTVSTRHGYAIASFCLASTPYCWFGAPEPGVQGDLFILLSQDRWVRVRGPVDDLKALTSGTWLSEPTTLETFFGAVAKLLVYANVAVAGHATDAGVYTIVSMLLVNGGLLALDNLRVRSLTMYGRTMEAVGEPKRYFRRRDLAEQLIKESGRNDWAVAMGLIVKDKASTEKDEGVRVTM
ncbi:uncharacterized protein BDZ99DRAFT_567171 [Mytilinidion resinicola]|uniref:Uncharacterized protein n=1 Tax=Mytilinidion resinicola TaxID=574789 RepID=A0A6A6Z3S6_9PEZI|nr:uncharacterized protein BDZ99DRAFT_567171 [Mytilinidion resinicola]KAF2815303.1 hypothetical protein BDZ99DRAFT_567171 [Mytilinidion resinicola]